ncbi:MAG: Fic family protein [Saprospiraceae bacterium]
MGNILPTSLPEIVFSSSNSAISRQISKLVKNGLLKKIAPRIYTSNLLDTPETIIRRNLFQILGVLYPGAVLSHRSALEFKPTTTGHIYITHSYTKKVKLPGLMLNFLEGPAPMEGDNPLSGELYASQLERALLENLQVSRKQGPESKLVPRSMIEDRLEMELRVNGEQGLNKLRDKSNVIAQQLDLQREYQKLNKMVSALLATQPSLILTSPMAMARALGNPYDPARLQLFEKLFVELKQNEFQILHDPNSESAAFEHFAFFEAYFSNYIEGTEFELEDAKRIVETGIPMESRHDDSHDVLGTYQIVSNRNEMNILPSNPEELLDIIRRRHNILLSHRASKKPGQFKDRNNRAGDSYFVDYTLVKGTLIKGFDFYNALTSPFARAAYIMFLISEVHPFLDGNGRIARVMMNAELVNKGMAKIIIPTVYRDDYLGALRRLTRKDDPSAYIKMLQHAHQFSAMIHGDDMNEMQKQLENSNAFKEHDEANLNLPT